LVIGFGVPALVLTASALANGRVPVNVVGLTAFAFPLSVAFAVYKRDLFGIDAVVQRGIYYATLSGLVTIAYLGFAALGTHVFHLSSFAQSPIYSLAFTLVAIFVLPSVRDRFQRLVDHMFGRQTYDAREVLAEASATLGSTLNLHVILQTAVNLPVSVLQL